MILETAYENLLKDPFFAFTVYPDGEISTFACSEGSKHFSCHIYSGSFNPITDAHKAIYASMREAAVTKLGAAYFYEISIERIGKEFLPLKAETDPHNPLNSLTTRLAQFRWYGPVIVTRAARFIEKAGVLKRLNPHFHVGADTALRMLDDYGIVGTQGIAAEFTVYDRQIDGRIVGMKSWARNPGNFHQGITPDEGYLSISSSDIRKTW